MLLACNQAKEEQVKLRSGVSIWAFTLTVTCVALVSALLLNFLIFSPELLPETMRGTTFIVLLVTIPTSYFVGYKISENTVLSDELERLVNRDRLTDVATRDFFFEALNRKPASYGVSLMVDIDHFKTVNDTHGHLVGDDVIRHVAGMIKDNSRAADIVCRFGGEEFVVFLHEADLDARKVFAERMRRQVEAMPTISDNKQINVTVSIGGSLKEAMQKVEVSIKTADDALYRAKMQGRNQSVLA